jgi:molybdopterin biosynthesis enzyme
MVSPPECPQHISRLSPLDDVVAGIAAWVEPVEPRRIEASALFGATLAEDVTVAAPLPPSPLALRDGWAVAAELTADAGSYAPAPLPGASRVDVGEALPPGTDAVVPLEAVIVGDRGIETLVAVAPGDGVLPRGADVSDGILLQAGRRLGHLELAVLRAAGVAATLVRVPRLRVARARAGGDRIVDAAAECIAAATRCAGALVSYDRNLALEAAFTDPGADAVIVLGGTGSGGNDRTISTLATLGELIVHGVALIPAQTTALGMVVGRPVLAVPGRLDAALAAWHILGRALLSRLAGAREQPSSRTAMLTHKVTSAPGLAELVPVRCDDTFATPIAAGYVPLSALAEANGWVFVPPASEGYPAHSEVVVRPWP